MPYDPIINDGLPHFLDLADGVTNYGLGPIGAPTPNNAITIQSANAGTDYQIQEDPDSPTLERAEQATTTKSFHDLNWTEARTRIAALGRGGILVDLENNYIRILSSTIQKQRGNKATLKIVCEGLSFDTPPDEFSCMPVELGINIIKHPRYFYALYPDPANDDAITQQVKQAIIRAIQTYQDSPFFPTATTLTGMLNGQVHDNIMAAIKSGKMVLPVVNINYQSQWNYQQDLTIHPQGDYNNGVPVVGFYPPAATANGQTNDPYVHVAFSASSINQAKINLALSAAQEIIQKLWKIEDSPYMVGFEVTWSVYYWRPVVLNPGGYIENPITQANPGLPDYFYSPLSLTDPNLANVTIFDWLAFYNPQCYAPRKGTFNVATDLTCLRKSDTIEYQRTWFKVTRSWLVSAVGMWDADINSSLPRPVNAGRPAVAGDPTYYDLTY